VSEGVSRRGLIGVGLAAAGAGVGAAAGIAGATGATGVNPFAAATNGDESIDLSTSHPFDATNRLMDTFRDADDLGGFATWDAATKAAHANAISQQVQALQDPLSRLAEKVATA
jgi:hypothetical protein